MAHRDSTPPMRTCIATRRVHPQDEMLRLVRDPHSPGRIIPDPARNQPGRGAWIVPTLDNYDLAVARKSFGRAFRMSAAADTTPVREYIAVHDKDSRSDDKEGRFEH